MPPLPQDIQEILRQIQSDKTLHKRNNAMKVSREAPELSKWEPAAGAAGSQKDMTLKCPEKSCVGDKKTADGCLQQSKFLRTSSTLGWLFHIRKNKKGKFKEHAAEDSKHEKSWILGRPKKNEILNV